MQENRIYHYFFEPSIQQKHNNLKASKLLALTQSKVLGRRTTPTLRRIPSYPHPIPPCIFIRYVTLDCCSAATTQAIYHLSPSTLVYFDPHPPKTNTSRTKETQKNFFVLLSMKKRSSRIFLSCLHSYWCTVPSYLSSTHNLSLPAEKLNTHFILQLLQPSPSLDFSLMSPHQLFNFS